MTPDPRLMEDVSAASAAYAVNLLPEIVRLAPSEAFERLRLMFEAALVAYTDRAAGWGLPEPSDN
ncbi:MAG: hypothetical protein U0871_04765 [Gemmataceae bacterium]